MDPSRLTAAKAAELMEKGKLTSEELVRACLARIDARDPVVRAWAWIEPEQAIRQARECDKRFAAKGPTGVLHGLPIGIKDVIDTAEFPTQHNSAIYAGQRPNHDASCIRIAKANGALIFGKTDTVEFAGGGRRPLTTNPHDSRRTPGGSSSGSAAAVADYHVPLSLGTQTVGSHIRPASFTGIYGLKPTHGAVPWGGVRQNAPSLDTLGWYGRSIECLTLVARAFRIRDAGRISPPPITSLKIGIARTHNWSKTEPSARAAIARASRLLADAGAQVEEIALPDGFSELDESMQVILQAEGGTTFLPEYLDHFDRLHTDFRNKIEGSATLSAEALRTAYDHAAHCRMHHDGLFRAGLDVILTPAATGEAPLGLHTTGDWIMNAIWTLLHAPCIAIPGHVGPNDMPVGIQIVGARFGDARLLAIALSMAGILDPKAIRTETP